MNYPITPINNPQAFAYTATAAASTALGAGCRFVRVVATTDAWIAIGTTPTAVLHGATGSIFLKAGVSEIIGVVAGQKISAVRDSADGYLSVTEGSNV